MRRRALGTGSLPVPVVGGTFCTSGRRVPYQMPLSMRILARAVQRHVRQHITDTQEVIMSSITIDGCELKLDGKEGDYV